MCQCWMCTKLCQQCSAVQLQRPGPMWHNSREATDGLSDVPWHRGVMWGYYHHRVDIGLTPSANCLNLELTHRTKEAKWIKANIYKMTKCSSQKSVAIMLFSRKERVGWRWKWNGMINCNLYTWPGCDLCFQQHHRLHLVNWMCHLSLVSALKISAGGTCQLASG